MNDDEIRQRVDQLKRDLVEIDPRATEANVLGETALILKTSIWARSEDPRRLADLTGIPLGEVQEIAEGLKQVGVWPLLEGENQ